MAILRLICFEHDQTDENTLSIFLTLSTFPKRSLMSGCFKTSTSVPLSKFERICQTKKVYVIYNHYGILRDLKIYKLFVLLFQSQRQYLETKLNQWGRDSRWSLFTCLLKFCLSLKWNDVQLLSWKWRIPSLKYKSVIFLYIMIPVDMNFYCISWPESFPTEITRDGNSLQVVGLDVFL